MVHGRIRRTNTRPGTGVFGPELLYSKPLGNFSWVLFQAEHHGIEGCVQCVQAAIKALISFVIDSKMMKKCLNKLNGLERYNKVSMFCIAGYSGEIWNETPAELTIDGVSSPLNGPEPLSETLKYEQQKEESHQGSDLWHAFIRQSKLMLRNSITERAMICTIPNRDQITTLTGFLTGHCGLRKHLKRIGLTIRINIVPLMMERSHPHICCWIVKNSRTVVLAY